MQCHYQKKYIIVKVMWGETYSEKAFEELMRQVNEKIDEEGGECLGGPTFTTVQGEHGTNYGWLIQAMYVIDQEK